MHFFGGIERCAGVYSIQVTAVHVLTAMGFNGRRWNSFQLRRNHEMRKRVLMFDRRIGRAPRRQETVFQNPICVIFINADFFTEM